MRRSRAPKARVSEETETVRRESLNRIRRLSSCSPRSARRFHTQTGVGITSVQCAHSWRSSRESFGAGCRMAIAPETPMWLDHVRQDARYALRSFARSPLFTLTAVLSLAIGIGADTAVFSVANALLLRSPSGVNEPDRLVDISVVEGGAFGIDEVSFPNYLDIRASGLDDRRRVRLRAVPRADERVRFRWGRAGAWPQGHDELLRRARRRRRGRSPVRHRPGPPRRGRADRRAQPSLLDHALPQRSGNRRATDRRQRLALHRRRRRRRETSPARASWRRTCGRRSRPSPRRIPTSPNAVSDGRCFADG